VSYKIATGGEANIGIPFGVSQRDYTGSILLVITGYNPSGPINANTSVGTSDDSYTLTTTALTTTLPARRYLFWGAMSRSGTTPTMTVTPDGATMNGSVAGSANSYHRVQGWQTSMESAGGHTTYTMNLDVAAAINAWDIAVAAG
jgi:hypothetical protein